MRNISILGVTGSIGKSTLKIYQNFKNDINILAISTNKNINSLLKILDNYKVEYAVVFDEESMIKYFGSTETIYKDVRIFSGTDGLKKITKDKRNNIIINGISGKAGLSPSFEILNSGIDLALANKESMVCAGSLLKNIAQKNRCQIIPVDSEHSAIFQLFNKFEKNNIANIILTASGVHFKTR